LPLVPIAALDFMAGSLLAVGLVNSFLLPSSGNYWAFQMRTTPGTVIDFSMKAEHPKIIAETFGLLEKLVT